jgi:hypothetical protein
MELVRSETWLRDDFENISSILEETIKEYVSDDEVIVNIESKTNDSGLSRFWIYIEKRAVAKTINEPQALPMLGVRCRGEAIMNEENPIKREVLAAGWDGYSFDAPNDQYVLYTECQTKIIKRHDWEQCICKLDYCRATLYNGKKHVWVSESTAGIFRELIKCE